VGVESSPVSWRTTQQRLRGYEDLGEQHFNNPGDMNVVRIGINYYKVDEEEGRVKLKPLDNAHQQEMRRRDLLQKQKGVKIGSTNDGLR